MRGPWKNEARHVLAHQLRRRALRSNEHLVPGTMALARNTISRARCHHQDTILTPRLRGGSRLGGDPCLGATGWGAIRFYCWISAISILKRGRVGSKAIAKYKVTAFSSRQIRRSVRHGPRQQPLRATTRHQTTDRLATTTADDIKPNSKTTPSSLQFPESNLPNKARVIGANVLPENDTENRS